MFQSQLSSSLVSLGKTYIFRFLWFFVFAVLNRIVNVRQNDPDAVFVRYVQWQELHKVIFFNLRGATRGREGGMFVNLSPSVMSDPDLQSIQGEQSHC